MTARGFSLVELLVSLAVCAVLSAAVAGLVPPARAAFDAAPAVLDLQQRGRTGVEAFAAAIRSASSDVASARELGTLRRVLPAVIPLSPLADSSAFEALYVVTPVFNASQGMLDRDQPGAPGALTLAGGPGCPAVGDVCGFTPGAVAAIADGSGRFDVFTVASTDASRREITPLLPFPSAYPAGSLVVEVDAHHFRLDDQADGSRSLVRETPGGATQPIVDNVAAMGIELWRSGPMLLSPADLDDGPFLAGGPEGSYDADLLTINRIELRISVEVPRVLFHRPGAAGARTLHATFALRNATASNLP